MPDVIEQLRSYGEAVEAAVPAATVREPRNRRPFLLAAAALVLVACTAAGVWALRADDGADNDGPVVDTTEVPVESGWQTLDPGPLEPREGSAVVWTGDEMVVWGGPRVQSNPDGYDDGAAYEPATETWRMMRPAPLRGGYAVGVWSGEEVLLWSIGVDDDTAGWPGAAWNPTTGTWRRLTSGPDRGFVGAAGPIWADNEMIYLDLLAAYDPVTDRWRDLPASPIDGAINAVTWTGHEVVALVGYGVGAMAYVPATDSWTTLPNVPLDGSTVELAWDGTRLVALDQQLAAFSLEVNDPEWTRLPALPLRSNDCSPSLAAVGEVVVAIHCMGVGAMTTDGAWAIGPPAPDPAATVISAGTQALSWWSSDEEFNFPDAPVTYMQSYRANPTQGDRALHRTIPVGTVQLDLPDGAVLLNVEVSEEAGGLVEGLHYDIGLGEQACRLSSTYAGAIGPSEVRIRNDASAADAELSHIPLEQVDVDRDMALVAQWPAGATDDQAHILVEESTSDVLDIACPDLALANALLERIHR